MTNTPESNALPPQIAENIPTDLEHLNTFQNLTIMGKLTANRRAMLYALCLNMVSDDKRSDTQIAEDIGLSRQSLHAARIDPTFNAALVVAMREIIKGKVDKPVENLFRLAEKDVKANEILLRIAEVYQPTNRNLNVNANIGAQGGANKPFSAVVDDVLIRMGELGWTSDRVSELSVRFDKLRDEGAF